jgi:hypothetical protein
VLISCHLNHPSVHPNSTKVQILSPPIKNRDRERIGDGRRSNCERNNGEEVSVTIKECEREREGKL